MRDICLLMAVTAFIVLGWFIMKKLDCFLACHGGATAPHAPSDDREVHIGLSDPFVAGSIADALEAFSAKRQNISVYLLSGAEDLLIREFTAHRLDVVFLPANVAVSDKKYYNIDKISLRYLPAAATYGGLTVEPITRGPLPQTVLWADRENESVVNDFIGCLKNRTNWRNKDGGTGPGPADTSRP